MVSKVDYSSDVMVVENVVYRDVIILEVVSSELSCSRALSKKVRDCLLIVSARWAGISGAFRHGVKM